MVELGIYKTGPRLRYKKNFLRRSNSHSKDALQCFDRRVQREYNMHRFNHAFIGGHRDRFNGRENSAGPRSMCEFCGLDEQTARHILLCCPCLEDERRMHLAPAGTDEERAAEQEVFDLLRLEDREIQVMEIFPIKALRFYEAMLAKRDAAN
jgi:hypothetical protein